MKNIATRFFLFAAAATLSLGSVAFGQSATTTMSADVPFAFQIRGAVVPAGHYTVRVDGQNVLWMHNSETNRSAVSLGFRYGRQPFTPVAPHLVFRRSETGWVVSEIWTPSAAIRIPARHVTNFEEIASISLDVSAN